MSDYLYDTFIREGTILSRDFYNLIIGERIGAGQYRQVYESELDKNVVYKFETGATTFENTFEWEVWQAVKDNRQVARWFAPCLHISPCGMVLIQARCAVPPESKYPAKVPKCFTDLKRENWGLYKGRLVCMDYGARSTLIIFDGLDGKLKKAKWWSEKD